MSNADLNKLKSSLIELKKGNIKALQPIYELTRRGVYSFVYPIMNTKEGAEDITQQTYVQVYEKIHLFDETKNPLNWIITIAKNLALSEIVKKNKEFSTDFSDPINENNIGREDNKEFDTPVMDLAKKVLNEEEFQIVSMFAIAEYKHREIAEILSLPLGTVTWKYNNAIKKLQKALGSK